jgi:hypothetical protein
MTIIAVKDGVMAADSAAFQNALRRPAMTPKILRGPDGSLFGACGDTAKIHLVETWFMAGEVASHRPHIVVTKADGEAPMFLILRLDGRVYLGTENDPLIEVPAINAIGSETACTMALGAMFAGATALEAVKIAIEHTIYVGGQAISLSIKNNS